MTYNRREALAVIAGSAATWARPARAAGFDWKRYNGAQVRFMVSTHPWTEWAQKQLAGLEAATGVKVAAAGRGAGTGVDGGADGWAGTGT